MWVIKQDERLYTLGEICEALEESGYKIFHLRNSGYLAKVINGSLDLRDDEYLSRAYTESDLDKLSAFLSSKGQELYYDAIESLLEMQNNENEDNDVEYPKEDTSAVQVLNEKSIVTGPTIEDLKEFMVDIVSSSLQSTVVPELHELKKDLLDLQLQNVDLKASLERHQEEHFRQIDSKLTKWREESFNRKTPWYKKLFK
jgi:DNA-binding transcriptional MerR regulator